MPGIDVSKLTSAQAKEAQKDGILTKEEIEGFSEADQAALSAQLGGVQLEPGDYVNIKTGEVHKKQKDEEQPSSRKSIFKNIGKVLLGAAGGVAAGAVVGTLVGGAVGCLAGGVGAGVGAAIGAKIGAGIVAVLGGAMALHGCTEKENDDFFPQKKDDEYQKPEPPYGPLINNTAWIWKARPASMPYRRSVSTCFSDPQPMIAPTASGTPPE